MTIKELKSYIPIFASEIRVLLSFPLNVVSGNIKRAKKFVNKEYEKIKAECEKLKGEKEIYITLKIKDLDDKRLKWFQANEGRIIFWIQYNILRRFTTGWWIGHQKTGETVLPMFDRNEIKFRFYKKGTIALPIAVILVAVVVILLQTFIIGYTIGKKPGVLPRPTSGGVIRSLTWLIVIGFIVYAIVKIGALEKIKV